MPKLSKSRLGISKSSYKLLLANFKWLLEMVRGLTGKTSAKSLNNLLKKENYTAGIGGRGKVVQIFESETMGMEKPHLKTLGFRILFIKLWSRNRAEPI
jgi:hypothetical protein